MAYTIGQLRKVSNNTYLNTISLTSTSYNTVNILRANMNSISDQQSLTFKDYALQIGNGNTSFVQGEIYYLRFKIHQVPLGFYSKRDGALVPAYESMDDLTFRLQLAKKGEEEYPQNQNPQNIGTFTVPHSPYNQNSYLFYSFVFSPKDNDYDRIVFKLERDSYDYLSVYNGVQGQNKQWLFLDDNNLIGSKTIRTTDKEQVEGTEQPVFITVEGKQIIAPIASLTEEEAGDADFGSLTNICPQEELLKFGFQSRPGTEIVVNGESIRVGRSGIYEINNGTMITDFRIAAPKGQVNPFLLDYAYNS